MIRSIRLDLDWRGCSHSYMYMDGMGLSWLDGMVIGVNKMIVIVMLIMVIPMVTIRDGCPALWGTLFDKCISHIDNSIICLDRISDFSKSDPRYPQGRRALSIKKPMDGDEGDFDGEDSVCMVGR